MLGDVEERNLVSILLPFNSKQGDFVEKAGEISRYLIHVNSGCLMSYFTDPQGNDQVIQFSTAGWWTGDLHSLYTNNVSIYSTRALTDSTAFLLPRRELDSLLNRFPKFEKYFRIIFQNSLITHQNRIIQALSFTAEQRYEAFLKKYPSLEQFVPQKYIASYLGITPEVLSKIRRRQMEQ
jgi:CRP-like cAMP-binding protein